MRQLIEVCVIATIKSNSEMLISSFDNWVGTIIRGLEGFLNTIATDEHVLLWTIHQKCVRVVSEFWVQ